VTLLCKGSLVNACGRDLQRGEIYCVYTYKVCIPHLRNIKNNST
jgi:hypothetical protein